jgi:hypothetical protein
MRIRISIILEDDSWLYGTGDDSSPVLLTAGEKGSLSPSSGCAKFNSKRSAKKNHRGIGCVFFATAIESLQSIAPCQDGVKFTAAVSQ